ncbi:hypothetical protein PENSPDRAFT_646947 [Peniophora sp. CONT]|nr:hypothetical protein PENSPDRAFT_646947 [Peniophora sp. CONT]
MSDFQSLSGSSLSSRSGAPAYTAPAGEMSSAYTSAASSVPFSSTGSGSGSGATVVPGQAPIQPLYTGTRDDLSTLTGAMPGDPRVIAPSRSSSLRRTSSMTDLDAEFDSALRR